MFAELAEARFFVQRDGRRVVVAHLEDKLFFFVQARVLLAGLQQRRTDAAAGVARVDRDRINSNHPRTFAQRQERVAREFAVYGGGNHRHVRSPQEIADRPTRDLILGKQIALELRDRVEILDNRRVDGKAALAPFVHVVCSASLSASCYPAGIDMSILTFLANGV